MSKQLNTELSQKIKKPRITLIFVVSFVICIIVYLLRIAEISVSLAGYELLSITGYFPLHDILLNSTVYEVFQKTINIGLYIGAASGLFMMFAGIKSGFFVWFFSRMFYYTFSLILREGGILSFIIEYLPAIIITFFFTLIFISIRTKKPPEIASSGF